MYQFRFHPEANTDLIEANLWYEKQQRNLGDRFVQAIHHTLERIKKTPEIFPVVKGKYREASVSVFPYTIVFVVHKRSRMITISAVYHAKRNPLKKFRKP